MATAGSGGGGGGGGGGGFTLRSNAPTFVPPPPPLTDDEVSLIFNNPLLIQRLSVNQEYYFSRLLSLQTIDAQQNFKARLQHLLYQQQAAQQAATLAASIAAGGGGGGGGGEMLMDAAPSLDMSMGGMPPPPGGIGSVNMLHMTSIPADAAVDRGGGGGAAVDSGGGGGGDLPAAAHVYPPTDMHIFYKKSGKLVIMRKFKEEFSGKEGTTTFANSSALLVQPPPHHTLISSGTGIVYPYYYSYSTRTKSDGRPMPSPNDIMAFRAIEKTRNKYFGGKNLPYDILHFLMKQLYKSFRSAGITSDKCHDSMYDFIITNNGIIIPLNILLGITKSAIGTLDEHLRKIFQAGYSDDEYVELVNKIRSIHTFKGQSDKIGINFNTTNKRMAIISLVEIPSKLLPPNSTSIDLIGIHISMPAGRFAPGGKVNGYHLTNSYSGIGSTKSSANPYIYRSWYSNKGNEFSDEASRNAAGQRASYPTLGASLGMAPSISEGGRRYSRKTIRKSKRNQKRKTNRRARR